MKSGLIACMVLSSFALAQERAAPVSLESLLQEARVRNPALIAASAAVTTAGFGPTQAGAFPDTEVMVQMFSVGDPRPFAGYKTSDFAYIGLGASQELPYPGKLGLRREVSKREVYVTQAEAQMTLADVLLRVKTAYYGLAKTQSVLALLERNRGIVEQIEQAAQIRFRTGSGAQQDVLRAQLERSRLLNDISMQQREAKQLQAQLRALLNRPSNSPDITAEALQFRLVDTTIAELNQLTASPELQIRDAQLEMAGAEVKLAQREKRPDFGLQYMWQHTSDNFRDYYMATFSVRLPNRKRVNAAVSQAEARRLQIEASANAQRREIQGEVEQELAMVRTIEDQLRIYREALVPQSEAAFSTGMSAYGTGRQEYQSLLASYSDTVRLGIEYQQLLADHEITVARIERLIGGELK